MTTKIAIVFIISKTLSPDGSLQSEEVVDLGQEGDSARVVDCVGEGVGGCDGDSLGIDSFHGFVGGDVVSGDYSGDAYGLGGDDFPDIVDHFVHSALIENGCFDKKPIAG